MVVVLLTVELQLSTCKVGVKKQCKPTAMSSMVWHDAMKGAKGGEEMTKTRKKCDDWELLETNQTGHGVTSGRGVTDSGVTIINM